MAAVVRQLVDPSDAKIAEVIAAEDKNGKFLGDIIDYAEYDIKEKKWQARFVLVFFDKPPVQEGEALEVPEQPGLKPKESFVPREIRKQA